MDPCLTYVGMIQIFFWRDPRQRPSSARLQRTSHNSAQRDEVHIQRRFAAIVVDSVGAAVLYRLAAHHLPFIFTFKRSLVPAYMRGHADSFTDLRALRGQRADLPTRISMPSPLSRPGMSSPKIGREDKRRASPARPARLLNKTIDRFPLRCLGAFNP